ncbi:AcrR family transcriptional regulator [Bacillus aryabhattai]|uniref:AcrR family transcriptional regulator n=1 Tax=Priestia aryabhattai TaxID=412384 RepID=A0A7W3NF05_PRIAR|nr:TetR/AcrR family transcriptional regulator [Priestia aryabhattai]MBA9041783.1 AcrR family transcriptional regulator [Priestia aryabhattai]
MNKAKETRKRILNAASELFSTRGYNSVTMREIAKKANCSHSTIYLYYQDKNQLLEKLAIPPLLVLSKRIDRIVNREKLDSLSKLKSAARDIVNFSIKNRSLYLMYMTINSEKVDKEYYSFEINSIRSSLFKKLQTIIALHCCYLSEHEVLKYGRMIFFQIHGTIMTYINSEEDSSSIRLRIIPILDEALEILLQGIRGKSSY